MGINKESDLETNLQIGPTDRGMVRIYVVGDGIEMPMDFDPSDAEEIAEEIIVAAKTARGLSGSTSLQFSIAHPGREDARGGVLRDAQTDE